MSIAVLKSLIVARRADITDQRIAVWFHHRRHVNVIDVRNIVVDVIRHPQTRRLVWLGMIGVNRLRAQGVFGQLLGVIIGDRGGGFKEMQVAAAAGGRVVLSA